MNQIHIASRALGILNANADLLARNGMIVADLVAAMDRCVERERYNPVTVAVISCSTTVDVIGRRLNRRAGGTTTRRGNAICVALSGNMSPDGDALENLAVDLILVALGQDSVYNAA